MGRNALIIGAALAAMLATPASAAVTVLGQGAANQCSAAALAGDATDEDLAVCNQALLDQAREKMRAYAIVAPDGSGAMTDARWAEFFKVASQQGVYPKDLDYRRAYTLRFVAGKPG